MSNQFHNVPLHSFKGILIVTTNQKSFNDVRDVLVWQLFWKLPNLILCATDFNLPISDRRVAKHLGCECINPIDEIFHNYWVDISSKVTMK